MIIKRASHTYLPSVCGRPGAALEYITPITVNSPSTRLPCGSLPAGEGGTSLLRTLIIQGTTPGSFANNRTAAIRSCSDDAVGSSSVLYRYSLHRVTGYRYPFNKPKCLRLRPTLHVKIAQTPLATSLRIVALLARCLLRHFVFGTSIKLVLDLRWREPTPTPL
jgi:hypothetical protein